jgi:hypothetical protein
MFVKYLTEEQITSLGFEPSSLCNLYPESFSIMRLNKHDLVNTIFSIWVDNNLYQYQIYTDKEGTVRRGKITRFEELKKLVKEYIDDDVISFLQRKNNKHYDILERQYLKKKYEGTIEVDYG